MCGGQITTNLKIFFYWRGPTKNPLAVFAKRLTVASGLSTEMCSQGGVFVENFLQRSRLVRPATSIVLVGLILLSSCSKLSYHRTPVETVRAVADKIIRETSFDFELVLQKTVLGIQFVDFRRTFRYENPAVGYALSYIMSDKDTIVSLGLSSSDGVKIWMNGQLTFQRAVLDHPESYEETSCTAMFVLGMARGVLNGWIDEKYRGNALRGWKALEKRIDANGTVYGTSAGTGIGDNVEFYSNRPTSANDPRGLGAVMIAGIEVSKLER